jgi:hypothetical protein
VIIALSIPFGMLLAGLNISCKLPDLYSFDLNRTGAAKSIGYTDKNEKIADFMAGYMRHKTDSFILRAKKDGETVSVFTNGDAQAMRKYRNALDVSAGALYALLPVSFAGYLILCLLGRKTALKYSIRAALIVYLGSAVAFGSVMLSKSNSAAFAADIIGVSYERGDVLPHLFSGGLFAEIFALAVGISALAMFLIFALTARLTRDRAMFVRAY